MSDEGKRALIRMHERDITRWDARPDVKAKFEARRDVLRRLVRLRDHDQYVPRAWAEPFAATLGKPLADLTLQEIGEALSAVCGPFASVTALDNLSEWRKAQGHRHRLFTALIDYLATGEGRSCIFAAARGYDEGEFLLWLADQVGAPYAGVADVYDGMPPTGGLARFLLTDAMRTFLERENHNPHGYPHGHVEIVFRFYVNYS